jgi:hypothetical protein
VVNPGGAFGDNLVARGPTETIVLFGVIQFAPEGLSSPPLIESIWTTPVPRRPIW